MSWNNEGYGGGHGGGRYGGGGGGGGGYGRGPNFGRGETQRLQIAPSFVGKVIGRGGSKIRELQDASDCRIKILKEEGNEAEVPVDITGPDTGVTVVKQLIEQLCQEQGYSQNDGFYTVRVLVENQFIGRIIGKQGAKIKEIQAESGSRVKILKEEASEETKSTPVQIEGNCQSIGCARQMIDQLCTSQMGGQQQ